MKNKAKFSVVIPTYTGKDHIEDCFSAILDQEGLSTFDFEMVVVIDGPNAELRSIIDNQKSRFAEKNIDFRIYQFKSNKGRFEARQKGAQESKNEYLLFLDDRNLVEDDYFKQIIKADKEVLIPNVLETDHAHFIARTMYFVRKVVYGKRWGNDFRSYEINIENFENSAKGTTSLWIKKDLFVKVCDDITSRYDNLKTINDDIRLLRGIVEMGVGIYRSSEAKIYYQPRKSAKAEIKHIFNRGPMFTDYYLKPGTRFFIPLIIFYLAVITCLLMIIMAPVFLLALFAVAFSILLIASFYMAGFRVYAFTVFAGLVVITLSFMAGLVWGIILKLGQSISSWISSR